jgi:regulator of cell morphogenesis and NO signaling
MNSSTTLPLPVLTPDQTVGAIVAAHPGLSRTFATLDIDYCCGGKRPLAEICAERGLDVAAVLRELQAAAAERRGAEVDAAAMGLAELADHIERTHHDYLRSELPRLAEMAVRVARKHGHRDPRLSGVRDTFLGLAEEMFSHMHKEEKVLFPLIRQLEGGAEAASFHCGSLANPIQQMEHEHDSAGGALGRLRELTDAYTPDDNACNTHRALLAGLAELETDMHQHVHKENNVLFPRALRLEAGAA